MTNADQAELGVIPLEEVRSHGEFVYLSGTVGREADGSIPADFDRQAELALTESARLLEGAGASMATVLKTTVFIPDRGDFKRMNEIYAEHFPRPWPTRSTLVTDLALPELKFEIEVVAHKAP
jgi:2-iminobutanoate/2-iminopropanoate deaminase